MYQNMQCKRIKIITNGDHHTRETACGCDNVVRGGQQSLGMVTRCFVPLSEGFAHRVHLLSQRLFCLAVIGTHLGSGSRGAAKVQIQHFMVVLRTGQPDHTHTQTQPTHDDGTHSRRHTRLFETHTRKKQTNKCHLSCALVPCACDLPLSTNTH